MTDLYTPPGYKYPLLLDAASRPYGPAVKASIYSGIVRYLSDGGSALPGKLLLTDEAKSYLDAEQHLVSNWETTADFMKGGYAAGKSHAPQAWAVHKARGGPDGATIYFSADWDATEADQAAINAYLDACTVYLGSESVGIYGGYYVVKRAYEHNPKWKLWQCEAWSGGQVHPEVHLYQRNSWGYAYVNGCQCDINEIRKADFGQWNLHLAGTTQPPGGVQVTDTSDKIVNYEGVPVTVDTMAYWTDLRGARNEALLSAILDKLSGDGAAQAVKDAFDKAAADKRAAASGSVVADGVAQ